jgi:hypothetical protein
MNINQIKTVAKATAGFLSAVQDAESAGHIQGSFEALSEGADVKAIHTKACDLLDVLDAALIGDADDNLSVGRASQ